MAERERRLMADLLSITNGAIIPQRTPTLPDVRKIIENHLNKLFESPDILSHLNPNILPSSDRVIFEQRFKSAQLFLEAGFLQQAYDLNTKTLAGTKFLLREQINRSLDNIGQFITKLSEQIFSKNDLVKINSVYSLLLLQKRLVILLLFFAVPLFCREQNYNLDVETVIASVTSINYNDWTSAFETAIKLPIQLTGDFLTGYLQALKNTRFLSGAVDNDESSTMEEKNEYLKDVLKSNSYIGVGMLAELTNAFQDVIKMATNLANNLTENAKGCNQSLVVNMYRDVNNLQVDHKGVKVNGIESL